MCSLYPALRDQGRALSWCSTRQNWSRKSILWPTTSGGDVSKRNLMEFTIASNEIQHIVIRSSKLAGLRRRALRWTNKHRKTTPTVCPMRNIWDIKNIGLTLNKSGKNAPMRLRSDFRAAVTLMNRLHRESGKNVQNQSLFNSGTRLPQVILGGIGTLPRSWSISRVHIFQFFEVRFVKWRRSAFLAWRKRWIRILSVSCARCQFLGCRSSAMRCRQRVFLGATRILIVGCQSEFSSRLSKKKQIVCSGVVCVWMETRVFLDNMWFSSTRMCR